MRKIAAIAAVSLMMGPATVLAAGTHGDSKQGTEAQATGAGASAAGSTAAAAAAPATSPEAAADAEVDRAILGTIQSVDAGMLRLENGSEYKMGEGLSLGDLGAGDQVQVTYRVVEDDYVATKVESLDEATAGEAAGATEPQAGRD